MTSALRFGCVGLFVTGVHAAVALLVLHAASRAPAIANGIAFVVATAVSYWLNTHWSFGAGPTRRNLRRFLVVATLGLGVTMTLAHLAYLAGLADWQGIVVVVFTIPVFTFTLHHFWTYR